MKNDTQLRSRVPFQKTRTMDRVVLQKAFHHQSSSGKHIHEDYAVNLIREGAVEAYIQGKNLTSSLTTLLCVNPDETHAYQALTDEGYRHDTLFIKPDVLHAFLPENRHPLRFTEAAVVSPKLAALFTLLIEASPSEAPTGLEYDCMMGEFLDALFALQKLIPPEVGKSIGERAVRKAKEYMKENYHKEISLDDIIEQLDISKYHFQRLFKKSTAISVHQYLIALRIEKAKQALQSGESLAQTTYGCGFYDQSHLNRCFKRLTGMTPGRYRAFFH